MKSTKSSFKSFKNIVSKFQADKRLVPNQNFGEIVIPIGSDNLFVELPSLSETSTFSIINTAEMTGAITLKTSRGASLKGLILNNVGGSLSIEPISKGATSFEMGSDVKDGCFVETISNGNEWFIWSVATNGSLGIGHVGGNSGNPQISTGTVTQIPAPVEVTITSETTFPAPSLEARHQLRIQGKGEPGTTIQVTEQGGAIQPITGIIVDSSGDWGPLTIPELLESGTYHFDFIDESPLNPGAPVMAEEFADDTGALIFTTPNSFTVERGTSFDFTAGAYATDPSGNPIAPFNTDFSAYNIGLAHNATFDIVYSFTYNGTPYTRTVSGVVKDTIAPAKPTITSAGFPSNINDFVATGNAEDGSTVEIFFDNVSQGTVTSVGGTWTFTSTFVFLSTFDITVQATDAAGNPSDVSLPTTVQYSPPTLTRPTLAIDNAPTNTWTNQGNPIRLTGTTDGGSTIVIKDGNQVVTPVSGPNYVGDTWNAEINVANESNSSLTVEASKANFNSPSPSITKTLLVDREDPVVTLNGDNPQNVYLGNIGTNNDAGATATDFSSATVSSDWATEVDATEGAKTVTYTATDLAGNSTTETRTVNVTTQVIVPVITSVTDAGGDTVLVQGTVTGDHANNLDVQIMVDGVNNGSPVTVTGYPNGTFTYTTTALSAGTRAITAKTINWLGDESAESAVESYDVSDTESPIISLLGNASESYTVGGTYTDAGATATDNVDDNATLTSQIVAVITDDATGNVISALDNTTPIGNYTIRYTATDSAGNSAFVERSVTVNSAVVFIEDIVSVITRAGITGGYSINSQGILVDSNGTYANTALPIHLDGDGIVSYDGSTGETVEDEFTISWWMNLSATGVTIFGRGGSGRKFGLDAGFHGDGRINTVRLHYNNGTLNGYKFMNGLNIQCLSTWNHFAIVASNDSSDMKVRLYVNGNAVAFTNNTFYGSSPHPPLGTKMLPDNSNDGIGFGGTVGGILSGGNNSVEGQFDSMQIAEGVALNAVQILAMANQTDRLMTIATASTITDLSPTVRVFAGHNANGLEHSSNATVNGAAVHDLDEAAYVFDNPSGNSATGHIFVPYSSDFDRPASGDLTAQCWFNADRLPSNEGGGGRNFGLISRTDAGNTPDGGWLLAITTESGFSTGGIQATTFPLPHNRTLPPSGGVTTGVWHHVALVLRNSGTATVYYDGQELSTYTYNTNSEAGALSKNYPLIISGFSFNEAGTTIDQHFDGKIKGVAIDQREVSAQEILDNYNNPPLEITNGATHATINIDSAFSFIGFGDDHEDGSLTPTINDGGFDVATEGTYTIQHSVTDSNAATTSHSFDVTVNDPSSWSIAGLETFNASTSGPWSDFAIGNSFNNSSGGDTVPTTNGLHWPSNGNYDPHYAKFADSLDIASMSVGQIYSVEFRKGRNPTDTGSGGGAAYYHSNVALIDFTAFSTFYSSTLGSNWDYSHGGGSPHHTLVTGQKAVLYARHNAEINLRIEHPRSSNAHGDIFVQKSTAASNSQMVSTSQTNGNTYFKSVNIGSNFDQLHKFTIEKTATGFDLGFEVHDGSSYVAETIDPTGHFGAGTQKFTVASLPNTLDIVVFNDEIMGFGATQTDVVMIQDLTITLS